MRTVTIYGLTDPETGEVRYVGQAMQPMKRLKEHVQQARNPKSRSIPKVEWIRSLGGQIPGLLLLEEVPEPQAPGAEEKWIDHYRALGMSLTNKRKPNEAFCDEPFRRGQTLTTETRARLSAARKNEPLERKLRRIESQKKYWDSPAGRKRRAELSVSTSTQMKQRFSNPKEREKASKRMKQRYSNPAERKKVSEQLKKRWATDPNAAAQKAALAERGKEFIAAARVAQTGEKGRRGIRTPEQESRWRQAMASPETRAKISMAKKGSKHTTESKQAIGAYWKGRSRGPEFRVKMKQVALERERKKKQGR